MCPLARGRCPLAVSRLATGLDGGEVIRQFIQNAGCSWGKWFWKYHCGFSQRYRNSHGSRRLLKWSPVSTLMRDQLHWLSVESRVKFKLALLAYKSVHGLAPEYLSAYCVPVSRMPDCLHLWSAGQWTMLVPRTKTVTIGPRGFYCSCPSVWNSLRLFVTSICHWRLSDVNWNFIFSLLNFCKSMYRLFMYLFCFTP